MTKHAPRPASSRLDSSGPDRSVAGVVLIVAFGLVALLLFFWVPEDRIAPGSDSLVTVSSMPKGAKSAAATASLPGSVQPRGDTLGRRLGERLVLEPRSAAGMTGYAITGASDPAILDKTRLQVGDILFDVDDRPLDPARIGMLGDELSVLDRVEVTLERDGLIRSRVISLDK